MWIACSKNSKASGFLQDWIVLAHRLHPGWCHRQNFSIDLLMRLFHNGDYNAANADAGSGGGVAVFYVPANTV